MFGKQIKSLLFIIVCIGAVLAGCHNSNTKNIAQNNAPQNNPLQSVQPVQQYDSARPASHSRLEQRGDTGTFVILDTVVNKDTIKFVLYHDSMIMCSINRLHDFLNSSNTVHNWDSSFADYGNIWIPGKRKTQRFFLNDSLLIVAVDYGYMFCDGGVVMYLLNRTKNSLKFAHGKDNPIVEGSSNYYVDLKSNNIMCYFYRPMYDDAVQPIDDNPEHGRYMVYKYKIKTDSARVNRFVQQYEVAFSTKEMGDIDMFHPEDSDERRFYIWMAKHENWKRDKYDSSNYQTIVVLDTVVGKDTVKVSYDNHGNVIGIVNGNCDTVGWDDERWLGYEPWRINQNNKQIIIPGGKKPVSFILNDTMMLINIKDKYGLANIFMLKRYSDSLDFINDMIGTNASYVYVDLKKNEIIEQADCNDKEGFSEDPNYAYGKRIPFSINRYKIMQDGFLQTDSVKSFSKDYYNIEDPDSYEGSKALYALVLKNEHWKKNRGGVNK